MFLSRGGLIVVSLSEDRRFKLSMVVNAPWQILRVRWIPAFAGMTKKHTVPNHEFPIVTRYPQLRREGALSRLPHLNRRELARRGGPKNALSSA